MIQELHQVCILLPKTNLSLNYLFVCDVLLINHSYLLFLYCFLFYKLFLNLFTFFIYNLLIIEKFSICYCVVLVVVSALQTQCPTFSEHSE